MKNICRKLLAVALSAVMLCLSSTQMVFADTIEMKNNRIDFIERDVTDTAAYLKYYMTINEKTTLVTEYVQIKNGSIIVDTSEIEVDRNSNINELSRNDSYVIYPIIDTVANSEKGVISRSGCNWKSHTAQSHILSESVLLPHTYCTPHLHPANSASTMQKVCPPQ